MALLFMDSFDHYVTADVLEKWTASGVSGSGGFAIANMPTAGRRGTGAWRFSVGTASTGTGFLSRSLAPADATCILGFAVSCSGPLSGASFLATIRDGVGAVQVSLRLNPDQTLSVGRGQLTFTLLGTTTVALALGAFAYVEWRVKIDDVTGTVDVWVNGVNVLSLTNVDTRAGTAGWGSVAVGQLDSVPNSGNLARSYDFDDVYVLDGSGSAPWNAPLGDVRVDARYPTAPGATTGWTPSAGANWAAVDETPPNDDTDYVNAATVVTDTYVVQDAPVVGASILGVQVNLNIKKMDAGTCTVSPVVRHGGVDQVGAAQAPGTTYAFLRGVYPTNPGTGAAWVEADFNAAEFGMRKVS